MKKAIKIGAVVIGVLIVISVAVSLFNSRIRMAGTSSYLENNGLPTPLPAGPQSSSLDAGGILNKSATGSSQLAETSPALDNSSSTADKKIIKNGSLNLRVDSVNKAAEKISLIAKDNEGDVFSSNFYQSGTNAKSGSMIVKVPFKNFEKAFSDIKKVAIVVANESTSGQDVTEQYIDLQAQLKNKQAEEASYVRLLNQAQKMDDILSITRQLSVTRGEIERLQGRIRYIDSLTDMATISISLSEDVNVTIIDSWRPWQVVKESTRELVKSVQNWINFLIRLIIKVIPMLILYGIIIFVLYRIGRGIYKKFWKKDNLQ